MVSAITTASSVCGCCTVRRMTTTARIAAPATIPKATYLPSARRRSLISAAEDEEPCGEDPDTGKARVDQCRGANVGRDLHRDEHLPGENGEHDPDDDADQPRREERAQDVDGRRHAAAGEREEDGDTEPATSLPVTAVEAWPSKMAGEPRATRGPDGRGRRCRAGFEHGHRRAGDITILATAVPRPVFARERKGESLPGIGCPRARSPAEVSAVLTKFRGLARVGGCSALPNNG